MPQLSDRVGTFTDSVIRRMIRLNNQYDSIQQIGKVDRNVKIKKERNK